MVMPAPTSPAAEVGELFRQHNPHLRPVELPAPPQEGGALRCPDGRQMVHAIKPGGALADLLLYPSFVPLEQLYRKFPPEGIFRATRTNPCTIEIGAFVVPPKQTFILAEYEFQPFRLNGLLPGDLLPVEPRRFATQLGYDVNFTQSRRGNIQAEMLPSRAPTTARAAFQAPALAGVAFQGPQVNFPPLPNAPPFANLYTKPAGSTANDIPPLSEVDVERARSAIVTNPAGSALWPPTARERQGPTAMPFTFEINEADSVQVRVTVFDAIRIPIVFFESRIAGYLVPTDTLRELMKGLAPCM